jgi:putative transposase
MMATDRDGAFKGRHFTSEVRVSNTLDAPFCIETLHEALGRFGRPEIFNTDQGSQFTPTEFTDVSRATGVRISMDGRGR